ncbi:MAG: ABC transporter permease [Peptostreptococcaceae bacterium]|nr:ABC transporter permease [Peptostreptococcaceae bacterium]
MRDSITSKNRKITWFSIACLLGIWQMISGLISSEIIFPSPFSVFKGIGFIVRDDYFWISVLSTVKRGLLGILISMLAGCALGVFAGLKKGGRVFLRPYVSLIRTTPVVVLILIALIWMSADFVPVFISFLISFPIIYTNTVQGMLNVDKSLVDMAKVYRVSKSRILREIYLPSISSYLTAGVSTAMGIGWKAVIAAEILSQPKYSIGTRLIEAKIYLEIDRVFAWALVAVALSFIFDNLVRIVEKRTVKWKTMA